MKNIFYKPQYGWAADAIPYYENGLFHIFYLLDYRNPEKYGEGTPWFKVTTRDFVDFTDNGEMLARGSKDEYDMYVFTGSVLKDTDGLYHIWYTGHNTHIVENYIQVVMHAVSRDLEHWTKIPQDTFGAVDGFEAADWRDPFVWYDGKNRIYKMLLSARRADGAYKRRGETILLTSHDNSEWKVSKPFWQPKLYYAHECPDLFKMGKWYYHVYSEFSHRNLTRYVMAKSLDGPWIQPADDEFDGRAFYAAKTVSDGKNRYVIGWNPTREGESDYGRWQWGGALETHKIVQRNDGSLGCTVPESVDGAFSENVPYTLLDENGTTVEHIRTDTNGGCEVFTVEQATEGAYKIDVEFTVYGGNRFGVLLNKDDLNDRAYGYFADVKNGKFTFELFPNHPQYTLDSTGLERNVHIAEGKRHRLKIIVEQSICVAYLDGQYALSSRMYGSLTCKTGFMCQGKIEVNSIQIKKPKEKK